MLMSTFIEGSVVRLLVYSEITPIQTDSFWILLRRVSIFLNIFDLWEPMGSLFLLSRKYRNSSD